MEAISLFPFEGNEKVLDVGCRDGSLSALLAKKVPKGNVLGIDISKEMVDYANAMAVRGNIRFEVLDAEKIPYQNEFDLATLFFSYEWLLDRRRVLDNCRSSLKEGGRLWIVVPVEMPRPLREAAEMISCRTKWKPYFELFVSPATYPPMKETEELLLEIGFWPVLFKIRKKEMLFPTRESFHKTLAATFPYIEPVPEMLQEEFLSEVIDEYVLALPADKYGRIICPLEIAQWIAVKRADPSFTYK